MISEAAFLTVFVLAAVFMLAGIFSKKAFLCFFAVGFGVIGAMLSGNVGSPDGAAIYPDYVLLGIVLGLVALVSALVGMVYMIEGGGGR